MKSSLKKNSRKELEEEKLHIKEHLRWLSVCVCKPETGVTEELVELGFATRGKSRFGEWVKITQKGLDFLLSSEDQHVRVATHLRGADPVPTTQGRKRGTNPKAGPAIAPQGVTIRKTRGRPRKMIDAKAVATPGSNKQVLRHKTARK